MHAEDRLEIHPNDAELRGIRDGDWLLVRARRGETRLRALITERVQPGVVYTTFHHPESRTNDMMSEHSDWATNCPEYKVIAVEVAPEAKKQPDVRRDGETGDIDHLVMMANDIGAYFAGHPNHDEAVGGIENHLRNFWEARMRREIIDYVASGSDKSKSEQLMPIVREAVLALPGVAIDESEDVGEG
jgi:formylmethanofuran dehydrogenase subunit D